MSDSDSIVELRRSPAAQASLAGLAAYLTDRRKLVLRSWRTAVEADPAVSTAARLRRSQFFDHIPQALASFVQRLSPEPGPVEVDGHGQHRWQQGYLLEETIREWGHFHLCLQSEIDEYAGAHPEFDRKALAVANRLLTEFCTAGAGTSAAEYFELHRIEAAGHVRELEQTLDRIRDLERQRTDLWRQAAHDLRGSLSPVVDATAGLAMERLPDATRTQFLDLLQRSMASLRAMVEDVTNLARLEAGQERREIAPLDVTRELIELCNHLQPLAAKRGLYLRALGPARLPVEGDAIKTVRIVQNLVINALKYTHEGGVIVRWAQVPERAGVPHWSVSIEDTGPGIESGHRGRLTETLLTTTAEANAVPGAEGGEHAPASSPPEAAAPVPADFAPPPPPSDRIAHGEGIGLSIVKRLCELLDAELEVATASAPGATGTTFRVHFPSTCPAER